MLLSPSPPTLHYMSKATSTETCDCSLPHPTPTGRCANPSIRSEEPPNPALADWSQCGCCMAACPDVHP